MKFWAAWHALNDAVDDDGAELVQQFGEKRVLALIDTLESFRPGCGPRPRGRPPLPARHDALCIRVMREWLGGKPAWSNSSTTPFMRWFVPQMQRRAALDTAACRTLFLRWRVRQGL